MNHRSAIAIAVGAAAALLAVWYATRSSPLGNLEPVTVPRPRATAETAGPDQPSVPRDNYVGEPAQAKPKTATNPGEGMLQLPDGTWVEPLNGVTNPPPMKWTNGPYAPIVEKRRGNAPGSWWWYVHADGTFTTTANVMRKELGRTDATTIVAHPTKPAPIAPDDLELIEKQKREAAARDRKQD